MTSANTTKTSPFALRLHAWFLERFPPAHAILFFVLYFSAALFGAFLTTSGTLSFGGAELLGFAGVYSFFLMLRVFDEHKDFDSDCINFPERVLQRGLISLNHLKVVGAITIVAQLGVSLYLDGGFGRITMIWLIVMGWSLLMLKEFFAGEWLQERVVLYALSHMVIMPMALVWMAQMGASASLTVPILYLSLMAFFSGFAFELARKTRAPEDEREGVDSYTKAFGSKGAPLVTVGLLLGGAAALLATLYEIVGGVPAWYWVAVVGGALALPCWALFSFRSKQTSKLAKLQEGMCSLYMLIGYVVLIVALLTERGVQWG